MVVASQKDGSVAWASQLEGLYIIPSGIVSESKVSLSIVRL